MNRLLLIEDEESLRTALADDLREEGFQVEEAGSGEEALALASRTRFQAVVTDLNLPGELSGLDLVERLKGEDPACALIMITAYGSVKTAVEAMKRGADDYLTKPFQPEELILVLRRALKLAQLEEENAGLRRRLGEETRFDRFVGVSPQARQIRQLLQVIAPTEEVVLIEGETGTGKELVAQAIHEHSPRRAGPYVAVSCASLSDGLLESELFGHEKGAFTGAVQRKVGRIESAAGGTLLLDEVDDTPLALQVKLLRLLQEREFQRVGSSQTLRADVRVLAATKRDLSELVEAGRFRGDLFYRLQVIPVHLPPLRRRSEDVPVLLDFFMDKHAAGAPKPVLGPAALTRLTSYSWPGNVRQLENLVRRLLVLSSGGSVTEDMLPMEVATASFPGPPEGEILDFRQRMSDFERSLLETALAQAGGNKTQAAERLGMRPSTFRDRLGRHFPDL
ncbi:MAG: sigma-54 dependent transcriptional regulator [bacterium]|nr:sigma-54 dependent transcriptional regulator [bacterium]